MQNYIVKLHEEKGHETARCYEQDTMKKNNGLVQVEQLVVLLLLILGALIVGYILWKAGTTGGP